MSLCPIISTRGNHPPSAAPPEGAGVGRCQAHLAQGNAPALGPGGLGTVCTFARPCVVGLESPYLCSIRHQSWPPFCLRALAAWFFVALASRSRWRRTAWGRRLYIHNHLFTFRFRAHALYLVIPIVVASMVQIVSSILNNNKRFWCVIHGCQQNVNPVRISNSNPSRTRIWTTIPDFCKSVRLTKVGRHLRESIATYGSLGRRSPTFEDPRRKSWIEGKFDVIHDHRRDWQLMPKIL